MNAIPLSRQLRADLRAWKPAPVASVTPETHYRVKLGKTDMLLNRAEVTALYEATRKIIHDDTSETSRIVFIVADYFNVTAEELWGRSRLEHIHWARSVAVYFIRARTRKTLTVIGQGFGRDHGTILNCLRAVADALTVNPSAAADIQKLSTLIGEARP